MTVLENLEMGAFSKKYSKGEMADHVAEVYDLFPRLKERSKPVSYTHLTNEEGFGWQEACYSRYRMRLYKGNDCSYEKG